MITFSAAAAMTSTSDDETSEDYDTSGDDEEYRPLSRRLERCDRVIQNEGDDS